MNKWVKDNKEMIKSILLGFTFVISIYSTLRTIGLEETISRLRSDIPIMVKNVYFEIEEDNPSLSSYKLTMNMIIDGMNQNSIDLEDRINDIEKQINMR